MNRQLQGDLVLTLRARARVHVWVTNLLNPFTELSAGFHLSNSNELHSILLVILIFFFFQKNTTILSNVQHCVLVLPDDDVAINKKKE